MLFVYFGRFNLIHSQLGIHCHFGIDPILCRSLLKVINLISAAGLAIEFTGHIIHNFRRIKLHRTSLDDRDSRDERVIKTMTTMGPAVVLGVTMTNLPGIITLNWAHMQIIQELIVKTKFRADQRIKSSRSLILWVFFNQFEDIFLSNVVFDNNNGSCTWHNISPSRTFAIR